MSDVTYSVKLDEELKKKLINFVKDSGMTGKEFFAKLLDVYESETAEETGKTYTREMKELEGHLSRIRALYENLLEEFKIELEASRDEGRKALEEKTRIEEGLRNEIKTLGAELKNLKDETKKLKEQKADLQKQLAQVLNSNEANKTLVVEYREKIENLKSSLSNLKEIKEENEKLKKGLEDLKKYVTSLEKEKTNLEMKNETLQTNLSILRQRHVEEIKSMEAKVEFEKQTAIANERQECQKRVENLMDEFNKKNNEFSETLKSLYAQIDEMRETILKLKMRNKR